MKILGIKEIGTVYRHINEGKLKATRLGGTGNYRITKEALEEFVMGEAIQGTSTGPAHTEQIIKENVDCSQD